MFDEKQPGLGYSRDLDNGNSRTGVVRGLLRGNGENLMGKKHVFSIP